ncbi:MAG TPA: PEP-CTERM sorting domain-containing protein, partial [Fimbriimonadaceae bacterium]|nr:PEP-CTERM sorting domain-containing protein [Fimbriimonadaceae bacterium]
YGLDNIAFGHNGILYGLEGFGDQIVRFDSNEALNFGPLGTFKLNYSGNPQRIAVYAAPEPFSMAGLAFGVAGVLLRRRAKRAPSRD